MVTSPLLSWKTTTSSTHRKEKTTTRYKQCTISSLSLRMVNCADLAFGSCHKEQTGSRKGRAPQQGMKAFLDLKSVMCQSLPQGEIEKWCPPWVRRCKDGWAQFIFILRQGWAQLVVVNLLIGRKRWGVGRSVSGYCITIPKSQRPNTNLHSTCVATLHFSRKAHR